MTKRFFKDSASFRVWRNNQAKDNESREMIYEMSLVKEATSYPAILVFQWLTVQSTAGGATLKLLHAWVHAWARLEEFKPQPMLPERIQLKNGTWQEVLRPEPEPEPEPDEEPIKVLRGVTLE